VNIAAVPAGTICSGTSVTFTATPTNGGASPTYQWKKNGTNISGATNPSFTATTSGTYTLMVTNNCGKTATSNGISVTVNPLPAAKISPTDTVTICSGDSILLQSNTNTGLTYQWLKNGTAIAGATNSSFKAKTTGNYKVTIMKTSTGCKKTSAPTRVVVVACLSKGSVTPNNQVIKLYPNPSTNNFHISIAGYSSGNYYLSVYDNNARLIANTKIDAADFSFGSDLKQGIYLVQIRKDNAVIYEEKLLKNK
jgi:hypothetical protein